MTLNLTDLEKEILSALEQNGGSASAGLREQDLLSAGRLRHWEEAEVQACLGRLKRKGALVDEGGHLHLTDDGRLLAGAVTS